MQNYKIEKNFNQDTLLQKQVDSLQLIIDQLSMRVRDIEEYLGDDDFIDDENESMDDTEYPPPKLHKQKPMDFSKFSNISKK